MKVFKVAEKVFVGKDILHLAVFKKNDERTIYHMIYRDGPKGITFMKRFNVTGITRDKLYDLTKGTAGSNVYWLSANPNGESEKVQVQLRAVTGLRKLQLDIDFSEMDVKARSAVGNIVTKYTVNKVVLKSKGASTLEGEDYWFDEATQRLKKEDRGTYLGKFSGDDKIVTLSARGFYRMYTYDVNHHFDEDLIWIEKYQPELTLSMVYFDGESQQYFAKRFKPEELSGKTLIIAEHESSRIELGHLSNKSTD